MMPWPAPAPHNSGTPGVQGTAQDQLSQQQTMPQPIVPSASDPDASVNTPVLSNKRRNTRIVAIGVILVLSIVLYFVWRSSTTSPTPANISQQNFSSSSSNSNGSTTNSGGEIKVYVVGAVKHAGVYTLPANARVYDLLKAAGGPLPDTNLVALNLAATLSDGQEVYVPAIGETPPTYTGGVPGGTTSGTVNTTTGPLVNINTASADEMRLSLHISSTIAQNIVNYRTQHGLFTSIDQLLQVVSTSEYNKIKGLVTI